MPELDGSMAMAPYCLGSFSIAGSAPFGGILLEGDRVISLRAAGRLRSGLTLHGAETLDAMIEHWDANSKPLGEIVEAIRASKESLPFVPLAQLDIQPPVVPRNLICAGMNYRKHVLDFFDDPQEKATHAARLDHRAAHGLSFMFSKPTGAIAGPNVVIEIPLGVTQLDWEIELVAVIGKEAWRVPRHEALNYVAGYTIGNDISARDLMPREDIQPGMFDFFGGKSGRNFNPIGPFVLPSQFVPDPQKLWLTLRLNGQVMQNESTADMIDTVAKLIEFASSRTLLRPCDLISTGSPSGNAKLHNRYLQDGDIIEAEIPIIGKQTLRFRRECSG
jgi:2-keto-4-pentenoate hydratase/2-oxohepta-3-ene-1,7-dioic acid hydratase in catechol pathway